MIMMTVERIKEMGFSECTISSQKSLCKAYEDSNVSMFVGADALDVSYCSLQLGLDLLREGKVKSIVLLRLRSNAQETPEGNDSGHLAASILRTGKYHLFLMDALGQETYLDYMQKQRIVFMNDRLLPDSALDGSAIILEGAAPIGFESLREWFQRRSKQTWLIFSLGINDPELIGQWRQDIEASLPPSLTVEVPPLVKPVDASQSINEVLSGHVDFTDVSELAIQIKRQDQVFTLNFKATENGFEHILSDAQSIEIKKPVEAKPIKSIVDDIKPVEWVQSVTESHAVKDEGVKPEPLVKTDFWGTAVFQAEKNREEAESCSTIEAAEDSVTQVVVLEEVQSSFWGNYKIRVLKEILESQQRNSDVAIQDEASVEGDPGSSDSWVVSTDQKKRYLVGKIAGSDLLDRQQRYIIRKGESITADVVDLAIESELLVELIINMTLPGLDG